MKNYKEILTNFLEQTNSDSGLILNKQGVTIENVSVAHNESVSAMSAAILSMCEKFLTDLEINGLKQLHLKTDNTNIFFIKINLDMDIVIFNSNSINLGLLNISIEKMIAEINNKQLNK